MRHLFVPVCLLGLVACEDVGGTDTAAGGETTCPVVDEITAADVPCLCAGENVTSMDLPADTGSERLFCEPEHGTYIQN
jgi:hypothetical protein